VHSKVYLIEALITYLKVHPKIKQKAIDGRRTGLRITGEADLIASLGYQYGTYTATMFAERLHQLIATAAYESSIDLAEERGAFPIWNKEKDLDSNFLVRMFGNDNDLMTEGMRSRHLKTGRRNIAILTIAPAGSVSILAQTSSGIEPIFNTWYFRKRKLMGLETEFDWIDENGEKWVEYPIFHRPFIKWYSVYMDIRFETAKELLDNFTKEQLGVIFKQSPYFEATAQDVDYVEKVRMQGAVQKWVDHSISVTVNMPEDVTEELVANVYREAYKSGCKGITIYRDNSRGNVLSTKSIKEVPKNEDFDYVAAHKRPKSIECDIYFKSAGKNPFIFFVGLIGNKPYEMFGIPYNDKTKFSKSIKKGTLTKLGKGKYTLTGDNDMPLIESITEHMVETEQNQTRSISALLRHRVDPRWIRKSIIEKYATINSFHKVAGKVLGEYTENGNECPECQSEMTMTEGCMKCPECGYTHCG
jgi:ribonucleoside-diphosphate reductase alpha chain